MLFLFVVVIGGFVYWYFVLLNYVKDEDLVGCSIVCVFLFIVVFRQLQDRLMLMEVLFQIRYGLYSLLFDLVFFDLEMSGFFCKNVYNSSIGVQLDEIDLLDVFLGNGKVSSCIVVEGSFIFFIGFLEVEFLYFICVLISDGIRIERDDVMSFFGVIFVVGGLLFGIVGEVLIVLSLVVQVVLQFFFYVMVLVE